MIFLFALSSGGLLTAQVDLLEDRLAGLEEQHRDVQIQIGALTEFLGAADGRVTALEESITQLEGMRDNLAEINKKNLIKVIFQLAWETYSTIDETTGTAKTAVESVANYGITYAAGRLAFEKTSDEARKAMGLDASNYYSSRTVSIRRLTEDALEQSKEVQKVYWALDKDLAYYRALKQSEEEGEDPGERGAIFFKNEVVRERIAEAIAAMEALLSTIESGKTQAQNDLEWLEGEQASIASLMEGVRLQLEQAREAERTEAVEGGVEEMLDQVEDAVSVPGFEFRAQREDEADYDYYAERYYAGVETINGLLNAAFPTLNSLWQDYASSFDEVEDEFDAWGEAYAFLVSFRYGKDEMSPADFGGLIDTLWDWRSADLDEDKLREALAALEGIQGSLAPLDASFLSYNNTRTGLTGIGGIASASAVPADETPPEERRMYTIRQYVENEGAEIRFPGADYASISEPYSFLEWYELSYEVEQLLEQVSEAIGNAADAASSYEKHYYGLQSAIDGVTEDEQTLVDSLEGAVIYLADTLGEADTLTSAAAFTVGGSYRYFHGIHDHQFTVQALSDAMEEALLADIRAEPARAQWDAYLSFVAAYEEVARRYRLASQQVLSADSRISGRPPTFLTDVRDAVSVAESIGYPVPGNSISRMESMATAYAETRSFVGELRAWEGARSLKEVRLLEDMTDTVPGEMEEPWIDHPLAQALPAFGLLLVKEEMDRRFDALMDMAVRDEDAMWDATYDIVAIVDAWKAAQTDG
ncbi:MAG: hypothetical protein GVY10_00050, partial [Verrucomicrobia bacterium]|nr:hypothetical protein [Verrucomicrobiota bacterium]